MFACCRRWTRITSSPLFCSRTVRWWWLLAREQSFDKRKVTITVVLANSGMFVRGITYVPLNWLPPRTLGPFVARLDLLTSTRASGHKCALSGQRLLNFSNLEQQRKRFVVGVCVSSTRLTRSLSFALLLSLLIQVGLCKWSKSREHTADITITSAPVCLP